MKKTRLWTSTIAAAALAFGGVLSAAPGQAAGTLTVGSGSITATLGTDQVVYFCATSVSATTCDGTNNLYSGLSSGTYADGTSVMRRSPFGAVPLPTGTYNVAIVESPPAPGSPFNVASETNVLIGSGGGGGTSSDTATSAPVEVSMSLDLTASGASCKEGSAATGTVGQWLTLPGADDCTSTTRSDAKLLGWSTSKDFPITIAQRQVSNGWGSYELTNESGEVTAVFIPAGGATFVSSGNSLFPIWAR